MVQICFTFKHTILWGEDLYIYIFFWGGIRCFIIWYLCWFYTFPPWEISMMCIWQLAAKVQTQIIRATDAAPDLLSLNLSEFASKLQVIAVIPCMVWSSYLWLLMIFFILDRVQCNSIPYLLAESIFFGYFQLLLQMVVVAPLVHVRQGRPGIECRIKPFRGQQALAFRRENGKVAVVSLSELGPGDNCLKEALKLPKSCLWVRTTNKWLTKKICLWPSSLSRCCQSTVRLIKLPPNKNTRDLHLSTITSSEDMDSASNGRSSNICATLVCPDRHQKSGLEKGPTLYRMKRA